jgi:hypothetical protein
MAGGKHDTHGLSQDTLGGEILDEWRAGQSGVQATVTESLDESRDRKILRGQGNLRMSLHKRPDDWWHDIVAHRRQEADVEGLALADREASHAIERPVGAGQQRSRLAEEGLADLGELYPARSTGEQRCSHLPFQCADLL